MTRDEAQKFLPLIQAFAEGKTIQIFRPDSGIWEDAPNPAFWKDTEYRIKPEPRRFTLMVPKPSNAFPDQSPRVPRRLENYNPEFWEKVEVVEDLDASR